MDIAYNKTSAAHLFMSNDRTVIESLESGSYYDDPLDLANTLKSFEYHLGDRQTQKFVLELINPNQQIENRLFASYAAANPRGSDPNGAFAGEDGVSGMVKALDDRVYYVRWGYTADDSKTGSAVQALSHMHKLSLINMHYSFSPKKERVFKLEFVDEFTKAVLSDTFLNVPRTFRIPVNTMNGWRSPSIVIQELILQMLLNVEGYLGFSKSSQVQNNIMDLSFNNTVREHTAVNARMLEQAVESEIKAGGFKIPEKAFTQHLSKQPNRYSSNVRFSIYSPEYAQAGVSGYATADEVKGVENQAIEGMEIGQVFRSIQGVKTFYGSLGLPLTTPAPYDPSSIFIQDDGSAKIATAGSPVIPFHFYSTNQVGGKESGTLGGNSFLKATTEASVINASEVVDTFVLPPSNKIDQLPRMDDVPNGPQSEAIQPVDYWCDKWKSNPVIAVPDAFGGFKTALTKSDLEMVLTMGKTAIIYTSRPAHIQNTLDVIQPPNDMEGGDLKFAWEAYGGPNSGNNNIYYLLSEVDRAKIEQYITIMSAKEQEFLAQQDFDPSVDTSSAQVIDNTALSNYEGALAASKPAKSLEDLEGYNPSSDNKTFFDALHSTSTNRDNPYLLPPDARYNIKCNVESNDLFKAVNKLLESINKRFFKNADKYLQFAKIENVSIPISKRADFELAMGVNISEEDWENREGFLILSTVSFILKLYNIISDGEINSFPGTDLTDKESSTARTISLSVGYESRSDNIVTDLTWNYPVSHLIFGLRHEPVAISKVLNVAKRWPMMANHQGPLPPQNEDPVIVQAIKLALTLNAENNENSALVQQAQGARFQNIAASPTNPNANDIRSVNRDFYGIPYTTALKKGPEMTENSLQGGDFVFTDAVLRAAQAQIVKMDRTDLSSINFTDSGGNPLPPEEQATAQKNLLDDMKLIFNFNLISTFFPALDPEDTSVVVSQFWVDGAMTRVRTPTFRKVNRSPLSAFTGSSPNDVSDVAKELIAGRLEWLNTFSKTIINAKATVLGIPEMDLIGDEIYNRNILLDVNEPRSPGEQHWLTGIYNPKDIVHKMDSKGGYTMDMTLVRSSKDTNNYIDKLKALRGGDLE